MEEYLKKIKNTPHLSLIQLPTYDAHMYWSFSNNEMVLINTMEDNIKETCDRDIDLVTYKDENYIFRLRVVNDSLVESHENRRFVLNTVILIEDINEKEEEFKIFLVCYYLYKTNLHAYYHFLHFFDIKQGFICVDLPKTLVWNDFRNENSPIKIPISEYGFIDSYLEYMRSNFKFMFKDKVSEKDIDIIIENIILLRECQNNYKTYLDKVFFQRKKSTKK